MRESGEVCGSRFSSGTAPLNPINTAVEDGEFVRLVDKVGLQSTRFIPEPDSAAAMVCARTPGASTMVMVSHRTNTSDLVTMGKRAVIMAKMLSGYGLSMAAGD